MDCLETILDSRRLEGHHRIYGEVEAQSTCFPQYVYVDVVSRKCWGRVGDLDDKAEHYPHAAPID